MKIKVFTIILTLTTCFIWINSALPSRLSYMISDTVVKLLAGTVTHSKEELAQATTIFNSANIRKLAHFSEYALLGCFAMTSN